jgi:LacI family transcriptional regulator
MSKETQRTLLGDVAREAGVSTATVSRVLNRASNVSEKMCTRVNAAIERLGYVPDGNARALASRRMGAIGALIPTLDNPIFGAMSDSLEQRLKCHDCRLLIATYRYDLDDELQALRHLVQQGIDGVVLIGHDHRPAVRTLIEQCGLPFLSCWHAKDDPAWPCIGFDNTIPARQLADHLLMLGHRKLAVLTAPTAGNDRARARLEGFLQATEAVGCPLPPERIVTVEYGIAEGFQAFDTLMALSPPPTAILCGNDTLAFGVMLAAQRAGVAIPEGLSITGFDDLPQARFMSPPLTTIAVPADEIGKQVADGLIARIAGKLPPHRHLLDAPLVLRKSTGLAPT